MVNYYKLDKILKQGTVYQTPADRFYVIKAIGTDATSPAKLVIDGVELGDIIADVAPLHRTSSNLLGPIDLGDYYYVVPPNKKFWVDGPSGAKMRIIGEIGVLSPGEAMPGEHLTRFGKQGKEYITYITGTATLASAGGSWAADAETEVISLTPKTVEKYVLNGVVMAKIENAAAAIAEGDAAIRFFLEGTPLDILTSEPGQKGVDIKSMPYPPADSTEEEPFSLADMPIEVLGDRTLSIRAVNTSGAAISASTAAAMTCTVTAVVVYVKSE